MWKASSFTKTRWCTNVIIAIRWSPIWIPFPWFCGCLRSSSITRSNNNRERGQPSFTPLRIGIVFVAIRPTWMLVIAWPYICFAPSMAALSTWCTSNASQIELYTTVSKAFAGSRKTMFTSFLFLRLDQIACWCTLMLEKHPLVGTNPFWGGFMSTLDLICQSQTFAYNLIRRFPILIGLQLLTSLRSPPFGRTIVLQTCISSGIPLAHQKLKIAKTWTASNFLIVATLQTSTPAAKSLEKLPSALETSSEKKAPYSLEWRPSRWLIVLPLYSKVHSSLLQ